RPEVEQLEERRLLSSSGVISAITDNSGHTTVFAIGTDQGVYQYITWASQWQRLSDPYGHSGAFRQVSAGLDASGRAVCYALHASDGVVWRLDDYQESHQSFGVAAGFSYDEYSLGYTATQIS